MPAKPLKRLQRKMTIENLWLYVMKVLLDEAPLRGYDIKKKIEKRFGFKPTTITVYTVVYRMYREGLIEKISVKGDTLYRPTEEGKRVFRKGLEVIREVLEKLSN